MSSSSTVACSACGSPTDAPAVLILAIAVAAFCATFAGGLFALYLKDKLHVVLGFSAGAVIAVAFFDLLPEAIAVGQKHYSAATLLSLSAAGFLTYLVVDRLQLLRSRDISAQQHHDHSHDARRGSLGAGSLSAHSFLDGIAIGLAFQASSAVGAIVTAAVLTHDFSDGINTLSIVLKSGGDRKLATRWLTVDAVAPALGVASTYLFTLSEGSLGVVLATFAGFFLYIGASDLIPESYHAHPKALTTAMTVLGAAVLYVATRLVGA